MKRFIPLCLAVLLTPALASAQTTIVNDSWADGGRNNGADPLDTDWWTSTGSTAIEVGNGFLGLVTGTTAGRGIHGTFTSQALNVGDALTATFTFTTPATVGTAKGTAFRIGLFDTTGKIPGLDADLTASSTSPNPIYNGLPGYMMDLDVNTGTENISFREHNVSATSGFLLSATTDYLALSPTSGGSAYSFAANTTYTGVLSVTRSGAGSLDLTGTLSQGATTLSTFTTTDSSGIASSFGMLAFHVISGTFGGATANPTVPGDPAADNGLNFTNIKIEYLAVPEPSSAALLLGGMLMLGRWLRRKA